MHRKSIRILGKTLPQRKIHLTKLVITQSPDKDKAGVAAGLLGGYKLKDNESMTKNEIQNV
ncbi:MAG: hypothetical protein JO308_07555, partial [Verrucomicrobia bacterium]|nr:hypothetical protein [Verrucomicrobiota bacterium]